jgi:arylsulfatase
VINLAKNYFILFSVISLILLIGIVPVLPFVNASVNAQTTCNEGMVLVYRNVAKDYLCLTADSAESFEKYGLGQIIGDTTVGQKITSMDSHLIPGQKMKQPNIIVIQADDVGWFNIGVYNQGIMSGKTPNIDQLAAKGMRFTDYYADPSCTAGRASLITGELPIRTGLTTVGQAGSPIGMPAEAPTIATILKSMGYNTGQFGKNHLGDLNPHLPTVHGFDEFFGFLYHLDAMEDPSWHSYPSDQNMLIGPRNMIHSWASNVDDSTVDPRWGKVGKQVIEDAGTLPPKRMETLDDEILDHSISFMDKSLKDDKPFFVWLAPSRVHIFTHLSPEYEKTMTSENGWYTEEAAMAELDDTVGKVMDYLETNGLKDNTIVIFTSDNGAEVFSWPDGGMTPFRGEKGTIYEGGMRVPLIVSWPGHVQMGKVENQLMSGLDWFPTLIAAAGNPDIVKDLKEGKPVGSTTYKVHLDGYNQMDMLTGNGTTKRNVVYYFSESELGAVRIGDYKFRFIEQPDGIFGGKIKSNTPVITNLRLDPFERAEFPKGSIGSLDYYQFYFHEMWRFVQVQRQVGELASTFIDYPPMQKGATFNLDSVKEQVQRASNAGD